MFIIRGIIIWFILSTVINAYLMTLPKPFYKKREYPVSYQIKRKNKIDIQNKYECAAFSTAYVLRHFGIDADGFGIYKNFPSKTELGLVYPKGIRTYLKQCGFKTSYYKGNVDSLKYHVSKGNPVIVFIKTSKNENTLHFVPITGYDKNYFYIAESLRELINCSAGKNSYNRKVSIDEFKKIWDIKSLHIPLYSNTYIVVE
ncbi:C39 family peptidase [Proteinivorax tanatarense]|uniref:C39 family peptidase n=1 Tax=Proteinivorax tanatarense TaxID=1260629 RepID=A0AAU7VJX7_9FIRM